VTTSAPPIAEQQSPRSTVMRMLVGNQVQQAIHVAARLRLADLVADGGKTTAEVAEAAGAHPDALRRLFRTLASFGVFAEDDAGNFRLTPAASLLRADAPGSLYAFALWSGGDRYSALASSNTAFARAGPRSSR